MEQHMMKRKKTKVQMNSDGLEIDPVAIDKEVADETKSGHYINNKVFYAEMIKWKEVVDANKLLDKKTPVTDYIGQCFLDIANHLSYRPNFINYPYREEMIGDGIENCLMYASNFDVTKSKNPFSYFTQIIYFAFLRRIAREKKQMFIKYKLLEQADYNGRARRTLEEATDGTVADPMANHFRQSPTDIDKFSHSGDKTVGKKKRKTSRKKLDEM